MIQIWVRRSTWDVKVSEFDTVWPSHHQRTHNNLAFHIDGVTTVCSTLLFAMTDYRLDIKSPVNKSPHLPTTCERSKPIRSLVTFATASINTALMQVCKQSVIYSLTGGRGCGCVCACFFIYLYCTCYVPTLKLGLGGLGLLGMYAWVPWII